MPCAQVRVWQAVSLPGQSDGPSHSPPVDEVVGAPPIPPVGPVPPPQPSKLASRLEKQKANVVARFIGIFASGERRRRRHRADVKMGRTSGVTGSHDYGIEYTIWQPGMTPASW